MKTNIVIEKERGQVIKICRNHKEFNNELFIYSMKLDFVPKLLDHNKLNTIIIEYIEGVSLLEIEFPDFAALADLFAQLHSLEGKGDKKICFYDSNPNNFIFNEQNNRYFMLDFSEWQYGYPEADLIHFLLFFASIYRADKFESTIYSFINKYKQLLPINPIEWEIQVQEQIVRFDSRREKYNKAEKIDNPDLNRNRELITTINW